MASLEMELLTKCTSMVHCLLNMKENFSVSIAVGDQFNFNFTNCDTNHSNLSRRISPSQRRRNQQRKFKFEQEKINMEILREDSGELISKSDVETQTEEAQTIEVSTNTDEETVEKLEDVLNVDSNGTIHPSHGEALVEVVMSHDSKT